MIRCGLNSFAPIGQWAIMDWYSRRVLAWRVSNTFDSDLLSRPRRLTVLKAHAVAISMDGKGRWVDVRRASLAQRQIRLHARHTRSLTQG